jgi:hypothetical protein
VHKGFEHHGRVEHAEPFQCSGGALPPFRLAQDFPDHLGHQFPQPVHGRQVETRLHADALVHEADAQAVVEVVQSVVAGKKLRHIAPLRLFQAPQRVGVADAQRHFRNRRLLAVEMLHQLEDPRFHARAQAGQRGRIRLVEAEGRLARPEVFLRDVHLLQQGLAYRVHAGLPSVVHVASMGVRASVASRRRSGRGGVSVREENPPRRSDGPARRTAALSAGSRIPPERAFPS